MATEPRSAASAFELTLIDILHDLASLAGRDDIEWADDIRRKIARLDEARTARSCTTVVEWRHSSLCATTATGHLGRLAAFLAERLGGKGSRVSRGSSESQSARSNGGRA